MSTTKRSRILRLATNDGKRVESAALPPIDAPEELLVVSFVGLTEAEQRRALAAYPGGRRFRLDLDVARERAAG
jgi:hypothetical protein